MPSGKQPASGPFARAVSAEVRAVMARQRISRVALASKMAVSEGYLGKRLRDEAALTLNDIYAICDAIGEDLPAFIADAYRSMGD